MMSTMFPDFGRQCKYGIWSELVHQNQKFYTDPLWKADACNSVGIPLKSTHRVAVMAQLSTDFFFFFQLWSGVCKLSL